jgi:uncharacterized protein (DUF488 family)
MLLSTIWTVGHSNHDLDYFVSMLAQFSILAVGDVRRFSGSHRQPQFKDDNLVPALAAAGIEYSHFPGLGGRRTWRAPNSVNTAWRVESFNAYADHMQTDEFRNAFADLQELATRRATVIMCAEAVPWRCHRRLIADALVTQQWEVLDIYGLGRAKAHQLTEFAQVIDGQVIYPG